jgi:hypothetical protein
LPGRAFEARAVVSPFSADQAGHHQHRFLSCRKSDAVADRARFRIEDGRTTAAKSPRARPLC